MDDLVRGHVLGHSFSGETLGGYKVLTRSLFDVKIAAARANVHAEVLPRAVAQAIELSASSLKTDFRRSLFKVDLYQGGGGIAFNTNINQALIYENSRLDTGVDLSVEDCNRSQSTADICATASRVAVYRHWLELDKILDKTSKLLEKKSKQFAHVKVFSRTCLRDALEIRLGDKFKANEVMIRRRREDLSEHTQQILAVNLGGTVVGNSSGASPEYVEAVVPILSQYVGINLRKRENLMDASQNMDDLGALSHSIALLCQMLIKLAKDLRLMHSGPNFGFQEIELPKVVAGSSFFLDKNNPTVVETLLQCCFQVLGLHRSIELCVEHGELDLNVFEPMAGVQLCKALKLLKNALRKFNEKALVGIVEANSGNTKSGNKGESDGASETQLG